MVVVESYEGFLATLGLTPIKDGRHYVQVPRQGKSIMLCASRLVYITWQSEERADTSSYLQAGINDRRSRLDSIAPALDLSDFIIAAQFDVKQTNLWLFRGVYPRHCDTTAHTWSSDVSPALARRIQEDFLSTGGRQG